MKGYYIWNSYFLLHYILFSPLYNLSPTSIDNWVGVQTFLIHTAIVSVCNFRNFEDYFLLYWLVISQFGWIIWHYLLPFQYTKLCLCQFHSHMFFFFYSTHMWTAVCQQVKRNQVKSQTGAAEIPNHPLPFLELYLLVHSGDYISLQNKR